MKAISQRGDMEDESLIKYLLKGLNNPELTKTLAVVDFKDVEDFLCKVKRYDRVVERSSADKSWKLTSKQEKSNEVEVKCSKCHKLGHIARDCTTKNNQSRNCFHCGQEGHLARDCTQ